MKSIKHCSGRLKRRLKKRGWRQALLGTSNNDGHGFAIVGRVTGKVTWFRRMWERATGEPVTLRTAAIRAGLLPRRFYG